MHKSDPPGARRIDWRGSDLRGLSFQGMNLDGTDFRGADLRGSNFSNASVRYADFRGADIRGASFNGANLYGSKMQGAEAQQADFRHATLHMARLEGAYLSETLMSPPSQPMPSPSQIAASQVDCPPLGFSGIARNLAEWLMKEGDDKGNDSGNGDGNQGDGKDKGNDKSKPKSHVETEMGRRQNGYGRKRGRYLPDEQKQKLKEEKEQKHRDNGGIGI